jgi:prepilin peptidase CpaA
MTMVPTVRLMLFPALMAFAASSDLLTMTISNRVSLILAGGFVVLAVATGASLATCCGIWARPASCWSWHSGSSRGWIGAATPSWRRRPLWLASTTSAIIYASLFGALTLLLINSAGAAGRTGAPAVGPSNC